LATPLFLAAPVRSSAPHRLAAPSDVRSSAQMSVSASCPRKSVEARGNCETRDLASEGRKQRDFHIPGIIGLTAAGNNVIN